MSGIRKVLGWCGDNAFEDDVPRDRLPIGYGWRIAANIIAEVIDRWITKLENK